MKVSKNQTMFLPMGPLIVYLTPTKWLWDPHVGEPEKNIVGMGVCRIVKQMGKIDLKN
jgi:hypothetical protein